MEMEERNEFVILVAKDRSLTIPRTDPPVVTLDPENQILFLGEGNFTFSCAFACLRGSWQNMIPTAYHDELPSYKEAQIHTIRNIILNKKLWGTEQPALEYIEFISNCKQPDLPWKHSIDATCIPNDLPLSTIWFQCPWVTKWKRTPELLRQFFDHVGEKQEEGNLIILGIISIPPYCESYALDYLTKGTKHYDFLGGDDTIIHQLLHRGYRHQGIREIHRIIYNTHISLIFRHK